MDVGVGASDEGDSDVPTLMASILILQRLSSALPESAATLSKAKRAKVYSGKRWPLQSLKKNLLDIASSKGEDCWSVETSTNIGRRR